MASSVRSIVPVAAILVLVLPFVAAVAALFAFVMIALPISRHILIVVPVMVNEVDRATAGVVFATMLAPVLLMAGRHVKIDRSNVAVLGDGLDHDRARVDNSRRRYVSDIDLTIEPRLADAN